MDRIVCGGFVGRRLFYALDHDPYQGYHDQWRLYGGYEVWETRLFPHYPGCLVRRLCTGRQALVGTGQPGGRGAQPGVGDPQFPDDIHVQGRRVPGEGAGNLPGTGQFGNYDAYGAFSGC